MFPLSKYKFYNHGNEVIAVSTYAGRTVKGRATCHPDDEFDYEKGKALAAARCGLKIARKRYNRATKKKAEAYKQIEAAVAHFNKMVDYENDSIEEYNALVKEHNKYIQEF